MDLSLLRHALKKEKVPAETIILLLGKEFQLMVNGAREEKNFEKFKQTGGLGSIILCSF